MIEGSPSCCPQQIADLFKPGTKGIIEQVGIARRCLNLRVAEELSDHRQCHAARNKQRREGVAKVRDADAGQVDLVPPIVPEPLDVLTQRLPLLRLRQALLHALCKGAVPGGAKAGDGADVIALITILAEL